MASDFRDTIGDFGGEKKTVTYTLTLDLKLKKREPEEKKLHERIQESFLNHEFSDVKITCESKVFDCHKVILSCQSDVFKGMLNETEKSCPLKQSLVKSTLLTSHQLRWRLCCTIFTTTHWTKKRSMEIS